MDSVIKISTANTVSLQEAIKSGRPFTSTEVHEVIQHFDAGTGPFSNLISSDYFVVDGELMLSLNLDYDEITTGYKLL